DPAPYRPAGRMANMVPTRPATPEARPMFRPSSPRPDRRGAILIVVLALLALFAVVGVSFVFYADSEANAARIHREGQARPAPARPARGNRRPPGPCPGGELHPPAVGTGRQAADAGPLRARPGVHRLPRPDELRRGAELRRQPGLRRPQRPVHLPGPQGLLPR